MSPWLSLAPASQTDYLATTNQTMKNLEIIQHAGAESANVDIFACNDQDTNTGQIDDPTGAQA